MWGEYGGYEHYRLFEQTMPEHSHPAADTVTVQLKASTAAATEDTPSSSVRLAAPQMSGKGSPEAWIYSADTIDTSVGGGTIDVPDGPTQPTGNGAYFDQRVPYTVTNYIICTNGLYPSRN